MIYKDPPKIALLFEKKLFVIDNLLEDNYRIPFLQIWHPVFLKVRFFNSIFIAEKSSIALISYV